MEMKSKTTEGLWPTGALLLNEIRRNTLFDPNHSIRDEEWQRQLRFSPRYSRVDKNNSTHITNLYNGSAFWRNQQALRDSSEADMRYVYPSACS